MLKRLLITGVLIFGGYVYAQTSDCKVNLPGISSSYSGDCKKGLAHGKGVAQGVDLKLNSFSLLKYLLSKNF